MWNCCRTLLLLFAALLAAGAFSLAPGAVRAAPGIGPQLNRLPLTFLENRGQAGAEVAYYAVGRETSVGFSRRGVTYRLRAGDSGGRHLIRQEFVRASAVEPAGTRRTDSSTSIFRGKSSEWLAGIPSYEEIRYPNLWPGIDARYLGTQDQVKSEFLIAPGADVARIRLAYRGASGLEIDAAGRLAAHTPIRTLYDERPVAYQWVNGQRQAVDCEYRLLGSLEYTFALGSYDRSLPLVIDPTVIVQCGYLGGSADEFSGGMTLDAAGNVYLVGSTDSPETTFPVQVGPTVAASGGLDCFVAKLAPGGTKLLYCGYIGGGKVDVGSAVAVDSFGNAYVTGSTDSTENEGFPVQGGFDSTHNGSRDGFLAKVDASGTALTYCTYLGGLEEDVPRAIGVDVSGNAYVCGATESSQTQGFPVVSGPDLSFNGGAELDGLSGDAFIAKIDRAGGSLVFCGYLGGSNADDALDLAVTPSGVCTLVGATRSGQATFPEVRGPDLTANGGQDGFVARLTAAGQIDLCGFFGGAADDAINSVTLDTGGNIYLGGVTQSTQSSLPVVAGPDLTHNGGSDGFVAKLPPSGSPIGYCGYIGGSAGDAVRSLTLDSDRSLIVGGSALSSVAEGFPVIDGPDLSHNGEGDGFVARVAPTGISLSLSTFIGGTVDDRVDDVAVDSSGVIYAFGETTSSEVHDFPVRVGPDLTQNGLQDAFLASFVSSPVAPASAAARPLSHREVEVTWADRSRNEDGFEIFRRIGAGQSAAIARVDRNVTRFVDFTSEDGQNHIYQVRAFNAAGFSSLSNGATAAVPPAPPLGLRGTILSGFRVLLTWLDVSLSETGFAIERREGTGNFIRIGTVPGSGPRVLGSEFRFEDNTAVRGRIYTYQIRTTGATGDSAPSDPVTLTVDLPDGPIELTATATGESVRLTWTDNNNNEAGYRIERRSPDTEFVLVGETASNATEALNTPVPLEREFIYRVRAFNGAGVSSQEATDDAFTLNPPGNVRVIQVNGILSLAWSDASTLETSYQVIRGRTIIGILPAGATSFELGGPGNITRANHTVTAVRGADRSRDVEVIVEPLRPPVGVEVVSVSRTAIDLEFVDVTSTPHQIRVERRIGNGEFAAIATLSGGASSFRDTQITAGKLHTYRLRAVSAIGESAASAEVSAGPLSPPGSVTATAQSSSRVEIRWTDTNEIEDGYEVQRRIAGQSTFSSVGSTAANSRVFFDSSVSTNRTFEYRVLAKRLAASEPSAVSSVRVLAPPTNFDLRAANGGVLAVWTNNATLAGGVQVEVQNTQGVFVVSARLSASTNQVQLANVPANATITARVRAFATRSLSTPSNTDTIQTPSAPAAMTGFAEDSTHVRLRWTDRSTIEDGQEIQQREVRGSQFGAWQTVTTAGPDAEEYVAEVTPERQYQFRVRARAGADVSEWCPEWPSVTSLAAPKRLRAQRAGALFTVRWQDRSRFEKGYAVEVRRDDGEWREVARTGPNAESYSGRGLKPGKRFVFRVRAFGSTGFSSYSNVDRGSR